MSSPNESASKYQRVFSITVDSLGIDPILDTLVPEILKIKQFSFHTVTQDERGAPDLISLREYGTDQLWWMLLTYNGIGSYRKIVEGTILKIPDYGTLISIVTYNSIRPSVIQRVISI